MYCPYGVRCQFLHSETNEMKPEEIEYSKKLISDIEIVKEKIQTHQQQVLILEVKPKKKDSLENINVFGKGRRLPVFQDIVSTSELKKK